MQHTGRRLAVLAVLNVRLGGRVRSLPLMVLDRLAC